MSGSSWRGPWGGGGSSNPTKPKHPKKKGKGGHSGQPRPHRPSVPKGVVEFKPVDPLGPGVVAQIGVGFVVPSVSGGWSANSRPRRKGLTDFAGTDPISMDIPILFDELDEELSVEPEIADLYAIMLDQVGPRNEPAVIELNGFLMPFRRNRWVINGIATGDEIRRHSDGSRIQAQFTVTVMEYVPGDIVNDHHSPAQKHHKKSAEHGGGSFGGKQSLGGGGAFSGKQDLGGGSSNKASHYTTKQGDTLQKIAVRFYGKAKDWHAIAAANDIRDPSNIKAGTKLKIPAHG